MITSTFLPAAAPPLPPPLALDESPDVRAPTTPTTTAIRAITATSDSENFSFGLLPDMLSPLPPSNWPLRQLRERFLNGVNVLAAPHCVKNIRIPTPDALRFSPSCTSETNLHATAERNVSRQQPPARGAPPHDARGRGRRRRQPQHRVAGHQRRPEGRARPGREGRRRGRHARLPPRRDRDDPAPRRPPVGEHRARLRRRREPVSRDAPARHRERRPRARRARVRRQLGRGRRARARPRAGVPLPPRRRADRRPRRCRPRLPRARPRGRRRGRLRRPPAGLHRRRRRPIRPRGRRPCRHRPPARRRPPADRLPRRPPPHPQRGRAAARPHGGAPPPAAGQRRSGSRADRRRIHSAAERLRGYTEALASAGVPYDPTLVRMELEHSAMASRATQDLLEAENPPTAVFAAQNLITLGAISALRARGLQHVVALIGFDDLPLADAVDPGLTVVAQDAGGLGRAAAETLFARLDGDPEPSRRVVLPTTLIPRGSGEIAPNGGAR